MICEIKYNIACTLSYTVLNEAKCPCSAVDPILKQLFL